MTCYVYLIEEERDGDTITKIGIAVRPHKRLKSLQTGNAHRLTLRYVHECRDASEAQTTELRLHSHFSCKRLHGEWFACTAAEIKDEIGSEFNLQDGTSVKDAPRCPRPSHATSAKVQVKTQVKYVRAEPQEVVITRRVVARRDDTLITALLCVLGAFYIAIMIVIIQNTIHLPIYIMLDQVLAWGNFGGIVLGMFALLMAIQDIRYGEFDEYFKNRAYKWLREKVLPTPIEA